MPKRYDILYLSIAERDLTDIFAYIYKDNPSVAASFLNTIDDTISKLAEFPELCKVPNDNRLKNLGYRMLIIEDYIVFYVSKEKIVEIRRILHGKRKYEFLL
jgi:toxin ParE1/3/4